MCPALASDPVTRVVTSCCPHLGLVTLKLLARLLIDKRLELQRFCSLPTTIQQGCGRTPNLENPQV